jgi:RNA polymerase sigma-70 factor (ECF subfamily)
VLQLSPDARLCSTARSIEPPATTADLLRRVAEERDGEAFTKLFLAYAPRVKSYMMRQGADVQTSEELVQETLLTVWRKASLYSGEKGSATAWILTIAHNLRIDRLRREAPCQELPENHEQEASFDAPVDEVISERQRHERMRAILSVLPAEQQEVVSLSYHQGLSHSAISAKLKVPLGTVKSRMRLAYQKVRRTMDDTSAIAATRHPAF